MGRRLSGERRIIVCNGFNHTACIEARFGTLDTYNLIAASVMESINMTLPLGFRCLF